MAKIEMVDIMSMEKMSTGMKSLDNVLDGGFRFGQLAILTGKRGEGKSTLASMWGCEALDQGYNCFFYSGELPDFYFRNWMDRQITKKSKIEQSDIDQLNYYYGERAFFYDAQDGKDDEITGLLESIEVAIKQKGCKFILVDNLMTALEVDINTDLYRAQSQFVGELAAMAKKYLVFIVLVAHPRKSQSITNDDISGSSNITDRADLVFNYGRIQPKKGEEPPGEDERRLEVMKNRLTGRLAIDKKGIRLVYDNGSKRIAEDIMDFFKKNFNWENEDLYDFVSSSGLDVPF
jgi:archaellum biogenesis ATPase FlaH